MTISVVGAEEAIGGLEDVLPIFSFCVAPLLVLLDGVKSAFRPQLFLQTCSLHPESRQQISLLTYSGSLWFKNIIRKERRICIQNFFVLVMYSVYLKRNGII